MEKGRGGEGRGREREAGWHECLCGSLNVHKHSLVHVLCGDHVVVQCLQCVCVCVHMHVSLLPIMSMCICHSVSASFTPVSLPPTCIT